MGSFFFTLSFFFNLFFGFVFGFLYFVFCFLFFFAVFFLNSVGALMNLRALIIISVLFLLFMPCKNFLLPVYIVSIQLNMKKAFVNFGYLFRTKRSNAIAT